jgi:hypothetical protein
MTPEYESAGTDPPVNPASKPIPIPLAVAAMAALVVGGGLLIWRYRYHAPPPPNVSRVTVPLPTSPHVAGGGAGADSAKDQQARQAALAAAAEADLPDGVHEVGDRTVLAKSGDAYVRVARATPSGDPPRFAFGTFSLPDIEWEHGYLTQGVRRILEDSAYAKELGVTKQQWDQLDALPASPSNKWPVADRQKLMDLWLAWETAADGDAKAKAAEVLVKALGEIATRKRSADQQVMKDRAKRIREVLNEAQLKAVNPIPRWEVK